MSCAVIESTNVSACSLMALRRLERCAHAGDDHLGHFVCRLLLRERGIDEDAATDEGEQRARAELCRLMFGIASASRAMSSRCAADCLRIFMSPLLRFAYICVR